MDINFDDVVEYVEDRPFNDPCYHSKSDKLRKLGWEPKTDLQQLARMMYDSDLGVIAKKLRLSGKFQ